MPSARLNFRLPFHPLRNMEKTKRFLWISALGVSLLLLGLRFINLNADFPYRINNSADVYTDEGWWSNSAIIHQLTGQWILEGDFNPVIYLPVFPIVQAASFSLFGLSLGAARLSIVLFSILACLVTYGLVARMEGRLTASVVLLLLSANFALFGFSRLALLELPMTCFILLSFLFAACTHFPKAIYLSLAVLSFCLALLTKTTALFALPSLLFLIWIKQPTWRKGLVASLVVLAGIVLLAGIYYLAMIHWYQNDLNWLFQNTTLKPHENALTSLTPKAIYGAVYRVVGRGILLDGVIVPIILIAFPLLLVFYRQVRKNPLVLASSAWIVITFTALAMRGYLPLRYYLPLIFPFCILFSYLILHFIRRLQPSRWSYIPALVITGVWILSFINVAQYLAVPQYSYQEMADDIERQILASEEPRPLILGSVANTLTLATGIPSINTTMGTRDLQWKLAHYQPNFYVSLGWNDEIIQQIEEVYDVENLSRYDVFDNYRQGMQFFFFRLVKKL